MIRRAFLVIGLALFVYLFWSLGLRSIIDMIGRVGWGFLLLAVLYTIYQVIRAWGLRLSLLQPDRLSIGNAIWVRVSAQAFELVAIAGPIATVPAKGSLAQACGLSPAEGYAASITEYLVYTFLSAVLSLAALAYLVAGFALPRTLFIVAVIVSIAMTMFLLVSAFAIWRRIHLIGALIERSSRLPIVRRWFKPDMNGVHRMEDLLLAVLRDRPRQFMQVAGSALLAHGLLTLELYLILRMLRLSFPIVYPFLIDAGTKFASVAFFLIPGQVGASEGTYAAAFAILQLPAAAGFAVALIRRLRSLVVSGVGLVTISRLRI